MGFGRTPASNASIKFQAAACLSKCSLRRCPASLGTLFIWASNLVHSVHESICYKCFWPQSQSSQKAYASSSREAAAEFYEVMVFLPHAFGSILKSICLQAKLV